LTKGWQRLIPFGKIQKPNITKELARGLCPLAKVKAIHTNESFLLQEQTKHLSLFTNNTPTNLNSHPTYKSKTV